MSGARTHPAPSPRHPGGVAEHAENDLAAAPPVSSLPEGPTDAVDDLGEPVVPTDDAWRVVNRSDDRVAIIRERSDPIVHGAGDVRTHRSRVLERIAGATNIEDGTWMLTSSGTCTPHLEAGDGLGSADLGLAADRDQPPDGDQPCESHPPVPVTIEPSGPVGDRQSVDAAIVPPRPLRVDAGSEPEG